MVNWMEANTYFDAMREDARFVALIQEMKSRFARS